MSRFILTAILVLAARLLLPAANFEAAAYLKASNAETDDLFGSSVSVSGDWAVIGAPREDSGAAGVNGNLSAPRLTDSGAAYVFRKNGLSWTQVAHLKQSTPIQGELFGTDVALAGEWIAVGSPLADGGKVYLYRLSAGQVQSFGSLVASNSDLGDEFGVSLALSGNRLVVGARGESSSATGVNGLQSNNSAYGSGAAYVFYFNGSSWMQEAYLKASNTGSGDAFGCSVDLSSHTLVIGASEEDGGSPGINGNQADNSKADAGAVYVFKHDGSNWSQQAYLKAAVLDSRDKFGYSVALDQDKLVIGAVGEDGNATGLYGDASNNSFSGSGAAYLFSRAAATWSQTLYIKQAPFPASPSMNKFGKSVDVAGDTIVVADEASQGSVHVFRRNSLAWMPLEKPAVPAIASRDSVGFDVALSPTDLLVGAPQDRSAANLVDGDMSNTSASSAGAAHVFSPSVVQTSAEKNVSANIATTVASPGAPQLNLSWPSVLGRRYKVLRSPDLSSWTPDSGSPIASTGLYPVTGQGQREFFRVVDMDATPPDSIHSVSPAPQAFAVSPNSDIRVEFKEFSGVLPDSIRLHVGGGPALTLAGSPSMSFSGNTLVYDLGGNALGVPGAQIPARVEFSDEQGHTASYQWTFTIAVQPVLHTDLFVFGSAAASQGGQTAATVQPKGATSKAPASGSSPSWSLSQVLPTSLTISYTGATPTAFHPGQYLANATPANVSQIFYRKVLSVTDSPTTSTLTLQTQDVPLTEMIQQADVSITQDADVLETDVNGNFIAPAASISPRFAARSYAYTWTLGTISNNLDGVVLNPSDNSGLVLSMRELNYTITPLVQVAFAIEDFSLKRFQADMNIRIQAAFVPEVDFSAAASFQSRVYLIPQRTLKTVKFFVWGLPVFVNLDFSLATYGSVITAAQGELYGGFRREWTLRTAVDYHPALQSMPRYVPPTLEALPLVRVGPDSTVQGTCSSTAGIEPRLDVLIAGLAGFYTSLDRAIQSQASVTLTNGVPTRKQVEAVSSATAKVGLSINHTSVDDDWPHIPFTLFRESWCKYWTPTEGWNVCPPGPPPIQGGGSDTSR